MSKKRHKPEEIVAKLRQLEIQLRAEFQMAKNNGPRLAMLRLPSSDIGQLPIAICH